MQRIIQSLPAAAGQRSAGIAGAAVCRDTFKLNCVPLAENGPADIMQLLKLAHRYNAPLRFIELMPLDCNANLRGVSGNEIRSLLEQAGLQLQPDAQRYGNGPASYWRISGYAMPVGFIEPLHNKFCAVCNRVRLTSVGMLKPCLYSDAGMNLKHLLRDGASDADLLQAMQEIITPSLRDTALM